MTSLQEVTSHHWRVPAAPFDVTTDDGVHIHGTRLGEADSGRPALLLAHGMIGWHRKPRFAVFGEQLTPWFTVFAMDMRGHGESAGICDFGGAEIHDIEAVHRHARSEGHASVVSCGTSMGGIASIRHGALVGGTDAVVAISSLAYWDWHADAHPRALRNVQSRIGTPAGRAALRAFGVRMPDHWDPPEAPQDVIGTIAPTPVVIVHGADDKLFPPLHARALYAAAQEPKRLLIGEGFGHAEDGLTPAFARKLVDVLGETVPL
ncbi:MAG: lysophospholipase [Actinomycetota bacterium]|nr:lysophospholipase [Actinomycetota bacterium]MDH5225347.1 lysophospholipase [Actinomycetota bacterium]